MSFFSTILLAGLFGGMAQAQLQLDPQFVVNQILGQGRDAKNILIDAQSAYTDYYNNYADYDWKLAGSATYEDSRAQNISGSGNLRDRTAYWKVGFTKALPTGTTLGVNFDRTLQNSTFRSTNTLRGSYAVLDETYFSVKQDLMRNFFGISERRRNSIADNKLATSELTKKESQENLVLSALRLFWDSYVAKETLRESIEQRDKYEALVKEVEGKSRSGFVNPGDLSQARAEYGAQTRNVKSAAYGYVNNLGLLTAAMKLENPDQEVSFVVKEEVPPLPTMLMPDIDKLRPITIRLTTFENAEVAQRAANFSANLPALQVEGKAGYTGLESTASRSFASMSSGNHPFYSVSLTFGYDFFSSKNKAVKNGADVDYERAFNDYLKEKEEQSRAINSAMENVRLTYASAISAISESKQWQDAINAQERSYRQGRLDFSQLIQNYNKFFNSRTTRIRAIGDYHIALHAYAAAIDQLVN